MCKKQPKVVAVHRAPKSAKAMVQRLVSECLALRIQPTLKLKSRHMAMTYVYRGQERVVHFASTPSDKRATANTLAIFRRQIREIDRCAA